MDIAQLLTAARSPQPAEGGAGPGRLPSLSKLLATEPNPGKTRSVLITHVLHTAVEYVELIHQVYPVARIVAVPYSADPWALKALRARGFDVILPASVKETFTKAQEATLAALQESSEPLIVQEVGGYLAAITDQLAGFDHFVGIVEDTNNGHWKYEQTAPHKVPILSMAQSPLKDVEDTIIGDAVVYSIERVLREELAAVIQGTRAAVIGFGKIGTSTAIALNGREAEVSIYDINPAKDMRAKVEGFSPLPLHELLPNSDLVVGATGQTSIRLVDMAHIKDGAILASASSKDVEFALDDFEKACAKVEDLSDVIRRFTQKDGSTFHVLYKGTPINFRDKSILGTILDMIYCELFVCMRFVAAGKAAVGLGKSPAAIQDEVAKAWMRAHSEDFSNAPKDKVWTYPDSLKLGLPKP
jgi:adenosylhomocysteinase